MSTTTRRILVAALAAITLGCHAPPAVPQHVAATQPIRPDTPSEDRDAVEAFFAAIQIGDVTELKRLVTPGHPNGIGGRTWPAWINDYHDVVISHYVIHILDRQPAADRSALQVVLSNGEQLTFYLEPIGREYHISAIDRRPSYTTQASTRP